MKTYIVLLRGVNVGGANKLPMKKLVVSLATNGFKNIHTYIQSGNIVLNSSNVSKDQIGTVVTSVIQQDFGFSPKALVLTVEELRWAIDANPFKAAEEQPKSLQLYFLAETPPLSIDEKILSIKHPTEQYALKENVFYLHAPEGIGRSKLAARVEKIMGVAATARNWRSALKILELAQQD